MSEHDLPTELNALADEWDRERYPGTGDAGWNQGYDTRRETDVRDLRAIVARHAHPETELERDLVSLLTTQREWSSETFGPGDRYRAILDHLHKELLEVRAEPRDVEEWIDVAILAFDGAWRTGTSPEQVVAALNAKYAKNRARTWPDWRTADPNKAIEHVAAAVPVPTVGGETEREWWESHTSDGRCKYPKTCAIEGHTPPAEPAERTCSDERCTRLEHRAAPLPTEVGDVERRALVDNLAWDSTFKRAVNVGLDDFRMGRKSNDGLASDLAAAVIAAGYRKVED